MMKFQFVSCLYRERYKNMIRNEMEKINRLAPYWVKGTKILSRKMLELKLSVKYFDFHRTYLKVCKQGVLLSVECGERGHILLINKLIWKTIN